MSNKRIEDNLVKAEQALNSVRELGEDAFDICDGVLENCKIHVDNKEVWEKVHKKEIEVIQEYKKRKNEASRKLAGKDPFYAWGDSMNYYLELRKWKSLEMLGFWNKLNKTEL